MARGISFLDDILAGIYNNGNASKRFLDLHISAIRLESLRHREGSTPPLMTLMLCGSIPSICACRIATGLVDAAYLTLGQVFQRRLQGQSKRRVHGYSSSIA